MKIQFSLIQALGTLALVAVVCVMVKNIGPLSSLIICVNAVVIMLLKFRYFNAWNSLDFAKKQTVCILVAVSCVVMLACSTLLWGVPEVMSDRLTTIYSSKSSKQELVISVQRCKVGKTISISGQVEPDAAFESLQTDILKRFENNHDITIDWDVQIGDRSGEKTVEHISMIDDSTIR